MTHIQRIKNWRKTAMLSASFMFALFVLSACKKQVNSLGSSALNPEELLASGGIDTFTLRTFTVLDDSVRTDNPVFGLLGAYHDPKVGIVNASIFTQLRLANLNPIFDATSIIHIDSMVLGLEYRGLYGKTDPQTFEVYKLTDSLTLGTKYYSYSEKSHDITNIIDPARATITPKPSASVIVGEDTLSAQLRLHLDTNVARVLMEDAKSGNIGFSTNEEFTNNYFKGLQIKVANPTPAYGTGGVFYFNMTDPDTKMTIYYRLEKDGIEDTLLFDFLSNSNCADFNHIEVDNSGTHVEEVINDTVSGSSQFYAQSFNSRAVVQFDGIKNLPANSVIQNALLVLPVSYQTAGAYYPSSEISVSTRIATNDPAYYSVTTAAFDNFNKRYVIDVRQYCQSLLTNEIPNLGLYLSPRFYTSTADRIIFNGPTTTNKNKPKLIVTYTKF